MKNVFMKILKSDLVLLVRSLLNNSKFLNFNAFIFIFLDKKNLLSFFYSFYKKKSYILLTSFLLALFFFNLSILLLFI